MKKFIVFALLGLMIISYGLLCKPTPTHAEEPEIVPYEKSYQFADEEKGVEINLDYKTTALIKGEISVEFELEKDEKDLERYKKYAQTKINSAEIGEVFYAKLSSTDPDDEKKLGGMFKYTVKLPKFYKNKELAVITFSDERTAKSIKEVTVAEDGTISFTGSSSVYAYAIVYNGAYKQVFWVIVVLIVVLAICVTVKVLCLRKDNPEIKERKKQKAINKKKQMHKQNKKLAQELKREREKLKHKNKT